MKTNLRSGKWLFEEGYDLHAIAKKLVDSSFTMLFHPTRNKVIFSQNELQKKKILNNIQNISHQTENVPFFFVIHPDVFNYFHIKIGSCEIIPNNTMVYTKEKIQELTTFRRSKNYAVRNKFANVMALIKQGKELAEKLYYVFKLENSNELAYFFHDKSLEVSANVSIYFDYRDVIKKNKIKEDYLLKFKICTFDRVKDFFVAAKIKLAADAIADVCCEDKEIRAAIDRNLTEITAKIQFHQHDKYSFYAEAQDVRFKNNYLVDNTPLFLIKSHDSFKLDGELVFQDFALYNENAKFIADNAFDYYKNGEKLKFFDEYFIFDFDLYSKLYHYFDKDKAEENFIKMLMQYRYDVNILKELTPHESVIKFLIKFYTKYSECCKQDEKIYRAMRIYILKLKGLSNTDAWCQVTGRSPEESAKSNATKSLGHLLSYTEEHNLPFIDFKRLIQQTKSPTKLMTTNEAKDAIATQIGSCCDEEVNRIIAEIGMPD